jgi:hypothetical protein
MEIIYPTRNLSNTEKAARISRVLEVIDRFYSADERQKDAPVLFYRESMLNQHLFEGEILPEEVVAAELTPGIAIESDRDEIRPGDICFTREHLEGHRSRLIKDQE